MRAYRCTLTGNGKSFFYTRIRKLRGVVANTYISLYGSWNGRVSFAVCSCIMRASGRGQASKILSRILRGEDVENRGGRGTASEGIWNFEGSGSETL